MKHTLYSLALFAALALNAMGATIDTNFTAGPALTTDTSDQSLKRVVNNTYKIATNTTTVSATVAAAGVTNVTGTTLAIVGNVGVTNGAGSGISGVTNVTGTRLATTGVLTNGIVVAVPDGSGTNLLLMYGDTGSANNSAPLAVVPLLFDPITQTLYKDRGERSITNTITVGITNTAQTAIGATNVPGVSLAVDASGSQVGFYTFVTNINLQITNLAACSNANYALGPEIEIAGVNRSNGRAIDLLNLCIWCGDTQALNVAAILITKAPCPSWTNGAAIRLDSADLSTNFMTVIPFNGVLPTSTNYIGTNCIINISAIGKSIKPLTNSIFLHCVSGASGLANTNTSWLRIAVGQN